MCVWCIHVCAVPVDGRRGHWVPGTGVARSCEPPCEGWELNPGLWQKEQAPLTTESSYQSSQLRTHGSCFRQIFLAGPVCDGEGSVQSLRRSKPYPSVLALKGLSLLKRVIILPNPSMKRALGHQGCCFFSRIFSWKQTLHSHSATTPHIQTLRA